MKLYEKKSIIGANTYSGTVFPQMSDITAQVAASPIGIQAFRIIWTLPSNVTLEGKIYKKYEQKLRL